MRLLRFVNGSLAVLGVWAMAMTAARAGTNGFVVPTFGGFVNFDAKTLDVSEQLSPAQAVQPFHLQSAPAALARWMYPFNANPGDRPNASVFGALGSTPDFDSRNAQFLLGWATINRVAPGYGAANYLIRRARVTLTIASGDQYLYTGTLRDYRTYFPTNDPRYLPPPGPGSPVELFGAGFRGGFTNSEGIFVSYAATNYPQDGPWAADPDGGFYTNRAAYAAGFDSRRLHHILLGLLNILDYSQHFPNTRWQL